MDTDAMIAQRLQHVLEENGANPSAVAKAAGMGHTAVRDIITRKTKSPTFSTLCKIADTLGMSAQDLLFGDPVPRNIAQFNTAVSIPRYDAYLSAGYGALNESKPEVLDFIPFTENFLHKKLGRTNTDGLMICEAKGESMEPTIDDGDLVMFDRNHARREAGMYVVDYQSETLVKRMEKVGSGVSLISDNPAYPLLSIQGEDLNSLQIIGKVVWVGKTY